MDLVSELKMQTSDLSDRLRVRQEECDNLRDIVKGSTEELVSLQIRLRESREQHSVLTAEVVPLRRKFHNLERRSSLLEKQASETDAALAAKKAELQTLRRASEEATFESAVKLRTARAELEQSRARVAALSDQLALQSERTDEGIRRVQELEVAGAQRFTAYDHEVGNKDAMIALYKRFHEDSLHKVEELAGSLAAMQEEHEATLLAAKDRAQAAQEAEVRRVQSQADRQLTDLQEKLDAALKSAASTVPAFASSAVAVVPHLSATAEEAFSGASSELYEAYEQAQAQAAHERGARREAELYLGRILKEIEAKAPVIAQQKALFLHVTQEKERLDAQLEAVMRENTLLRDHVKGIEVDADAALEQAEALEQQNADLSRQLQHVLGGSPGAADGDVVSERLVTFSDAQELQARNAQLLKVVRALSKDPDAAISAAGTKVTSALGGCKPLSDTLTAALGELQAMREARSKAESLLHAALLQRDEYKALLPASQLVPSAEKENNAVGITNGAAAPAAAPASAIARSSAADEAAIQRLQQRCDNLQKELSDARKAAAAAAEAHAAALLAAKGETGALRGEAAHWEGVGRSAMEKQERLERSLHSLRVECTSAVNSRLDLEALVPELERRLQRAEVDAADGAATARAAEDSARAAEMEVALARSAEHAAEEALAAMREESKAEALLAESLRRVESGLAARHADEKEALTRDRDALARDLLALRKQLHELEILSSQRCAALDAELVSARAAADAGAAEAHAARLALVRQEGVAKGGQERAALLEKQLARAQERMSALQGHSSMEDVLAKEAAEHSSALELAQSEARDASALAAAADQHATYFQAIATAAEKKWLELQKLHAETTARDLASIQAKTAELEQAQAASTAEQARAEALQAEMLGLQAELSAQQAAQLALVTEHEAELGACSAATASSRSLGVQQEAEIGRLNAALAAAEGSLAEHKALLQVATDAQAAAEAEAARTATALALNNQAIAELSASAVVQQLQLSEDKSKAEAALGELKESNQELRRSNDLLHAQMQTLAARVRRYEEDGLRPGAAGTGTAETDASGVEEQLKVSLDELREVLWTIKRERDMLAAKLAVAESEAARHRGAVTALQAAADEARLTSKRESEKLAPTRGEKEFAQLLQQVQQLGKVRDQSQAVHADNERLAQTNEKLAKELQVVKEGVAPRERQARMLQAEKAQLEAQVAQLGTERVTWMTRVEEVLERYADVDPADYRAVRDRETEARSDAAAARAQLQQAAMDAAEQEKTHLAAHAAKEEELSTVRAAKGASEKSAEMLRTKLRQLKGLQEVATKKEAETAAALEALQVEVETLRAKAAAQEMRDAAARAALEEEEMQEEAAAAAAATATATATAATTVASSATEVKAGAAAGPEAEAEGAPRSRKRPQPEEPSSLTPAPAPAAALVDEALLIPPSAATPAAGTATGTGTDATTTNMTAAQKQQEMERLKALLIKKKSSKSHVSAAAPAATTASASGAGTSSAAPATATAGDAEDGAAPLAKRPRGARSSSIASIASSVSNPLAGDDAAGATDTKSAADEPALPVRSANPFAAAAAASVVSGTGSSSGSGSEVATAGAVSGSGPGTALPASTILKATATSFTPFTNPFALGSSGGSSSGSSAAGTVGASFGSSALPLFGSKKTGSGSGFGSFMGGAKAAASPFGTPFSAAASASTSAPAAGVASAGEVVAAAPEDDDAAAKARRAARFASSGGSAGNADGDEE